jgi:uncharacterized membrane protein YphA (DoxX/SURF4 family)
MKSTLSIQLENGNAQTGRKAMFKSAGLWTIQVLLALVFLFAGSMKLLTPIDVMMAQMTVPLPGWFIQFIGVAEVAGALGLLLPGLFRIRRVLTPLAACGLILIMIGATIITAATMDVVSALFPLVVGLLCLLVAYGRRAWKLA